MIERTNFHKIFKVNMDGSIEPRHVVRVSGVQMGPGVKFGKKVRFSGINLGKFVGRDFAVEKDESDVFVIRGIY